MLNWWQRTECKLLLSTRWLSDFNKTSRKHQAIGFGQGPFNKLVFRFRSPSSKCLRSWMRWEYLHDVRACCVCTEFTYSSCIRLALKYSNIWAETTCVGWFGGGHFKGPSNVQRSKHSKHGHQAWFSCRIVVVNVNYRQVVKNKQRFFSLLFRSRAPQPATAGSTFLSSGFKFRGASRTWIAVMAVDGIRSAEGLRVWKRKVQLDHTWPTSDTCSGLGADMASLARDL